MGAEKSGLSIFFSELCRAERHRVLETLKAHGVRVAMMHNASFWTIHLILTYLGTYNAQYVHPLGMGSFDFFFSLVFICWRTMTTA